MAVTAITKTVLGVNNWTKVVPKKVTAKSDGFSIDYDVADERSMILVSSATGGTVTVKAGNGIQGVKDLEAFTLAANDTAAIMIDSGAFKNVTGADKGKVKVIPSADDTTCALIELY